MPYRPFLCRIQKLFGWQRTHPESSEQKWKSTRLKRSAQPMTDQQLARTIRECRQTPVSDLTLRELGHHIERN